MPQRPRAPGPESEPPIERSRFRIKSVRKALAWFIAASAAVAGIAGWSGLTLRDLLFLQQSPAVAVPDPGKKSSGTQVVVNQGNNHGQVANTINNYLPSAPQNQDNPLTTVPLSQDQVCPRSDPTDATLPEVEIQVVFSCKGPVIDMNGDVVENQIEVKLRPRIVNNSDHALDIALSNPSPLRLLVRGNAIDQRWTPPPRTREAGDRPVLVACDGQTFWGIPPNQPQDAYIPRHGTLWTGFATVWDANIVWPGSIYFKPRRRRDDGYWIREGDLVFEVPLDDAGKVEVAALALVALQSGGTWKPMAFAPRKAWPPATFAGEF